MIIGITGLAGAGKDTLADILVAKHGFVKVGLADPLKRFCREAFDFTAEQLWGPSETRNAPDPRYERVPATSQIGEFDWSQRTIPAEYLTPRYALQKLGTEWGRACYGDIWIDLTLRTARRLERGGYGYNAMCGLRGPCGEDEENPQNVVIPDVRFANELKKIRAERTGFLVKIVRTGAGLTGAAAAHQSETEQEGFKDSDFDLVIWNDRGLDLLESFAGDLARWGKVAGVPQAAPKELVEQYAEGPCPYCGSSCICASRL